MHSPCLITRLLRGEIGEQQDDSSCEMRNLGKWDLVMDFSVTLLVWSLVHGYAGTFCIWKGIKCQKAQILVKILIILQKCRNLRTSGLFFPQSFMFNVLIPCLEVALYIVCRTIQKILFVFFLLPQWFNGSRLWREIPTAFWFETCRKSAYELGSS